MLACPFLGLADAVRLADGDLHVPRVQACTSSLAAMFLRRVQQVKSTDCAWAA